MRIMVNLKYNGDTLVITHEGGKNYGTVYMTVAPNATFGVGNSFGGYFARQVRNNLLELIRVSGSEKHLPPQQLGEITKERKGQILWPGVGLWAVSSGSALRGVFHRQRPDGDPIKQALREAGMPSNLTAVVEKIDMLAEEGGPLCQHCVHSEWEKVLHSDGKKTTVEEGRRVTEHFNQYHIGCQLTPDMVKIEGGTYVIQSLLRISGGGSWYPSIEMVTLTVGADRKVIAEKIREIMKR